MKRKSYSLEAKKEVIEWITTEGNAIPTRAAKKFKLPPGTVRSWWNSRDEIMNADKLERKRLTGGGRKGFMIDYDEEISESILFLRNSKERVTRQTVKDIALEIAKRENVQEFYASDGWLTRFMERNRFSFRRVTNLTALSDEKLLERGYEYMKYLRTVIERATPHNTILMDETAVYLEDPRRTTIAPTGSKHVLLNTTGFASMRITVVLAVRADGNKLPPLVIFKGKDTDQIENKNGVWIVRQSKAWVNQFLLQKWLERVFPRVSNARGKLLVWDSCRAHLSKSIKQFMKIEGILSAVIPAGLTAYVQAGDIGIYKSFKDNMSPLISEWKASGTVELTRGGNPKPPKEEVVCKWVITAWRNVDNEVIKKSIVRAGFHDDFEKWHLSRHDIYGQRFKTLWLSNRSENVDEFEVQEEEEEDPFLLEED